MKKLNVLLLMFCLTVVLVVGNAPVGNAYSPLLQQKDLIYEGAFKVPKGNLGPDDWDTLARGGTALAFNPARNSLLLIGHSYGNKLFELSIPAIKNSNDLSNLDTATLLQLPVDITEGHLSKLALDGSSLTHPVPGGFLVYGERLIGSAYVYFDAGNQGYRSHFYASLNWSQEGPNFHGMYIVGTAEHANGGYVGGYMSLIPPEWREALGGPALTGLAAVSVISRSSYGPCAWVFNPDDLGKKDPVPAFMLVGYPQGHETLGDGSLSQPSLYFNQATEIKGLVFPYGTSSVLFFGRHGLGETGQGDTCYGIGTSDRTLAEQDDEYCYDPTNSAKGGHGYPYVYRIWAYDAHDLARVKAGEINPWDVKPYAIWNLDFSFAIENAHILGAAYDPSTQRIFISEYGGDSTNYDPYPLVHVFKVNISTNENNNSGTPPSPPNNLRISN